MSVRRQGALPGAGGLRGCATLAPAGLRDPPRVCAPSYQNDVDKLKNAKRRTMIRRLKALIYEKEEKEPQIALNHIVPFRRGASGEF